MRTKLSCPVLKGKISICNKCGDRFELNRRALRQAMPICNTCVVSPKKAKINSAMSFLDNLAKKEGIDL
jgi:RNA polymerase-binding transcription factor DksA